MKGVIFGRMRRLTRAVRPQIVVLAAVLLCCYAGIGGEPALARTWHRVLTPGATRVVRAMPVIVPGSTGEASKEIATDQPQNCAVVACLALTFDDGPNPITTPQILSIL